MRNYPASLVAGFVHALMRSAPLAGVLRGAGLAALAAAASLLAACNGGGISGEPPQLRVINEDFGAATSFDVRVNSTSIVTNLGFGQATSFQPVTPGSNTVVAFDPTGTTTAVLTASFTTAFGASYSVFALAGSALVVAQDNAPVAAGKARLSLVHAFPGQGALDIYLTAPTANLPVSPSISALTYGAGASGASAIAPGVLTVASGDYRIRATAAGDATQKVLFDSGPITLESGADLLMAVVQTSGSAAPFSLVSLDDASNVFQILDQRVQLRMGNFAPALGAVDAFLNPGTNVNSPATLFFSDLTLGGVTPYVAEMPGAYEASMAVTTQFQSVVQAPLALSASTSISVFAIGLRGQASPTNLQLLTLLDDLSAPPSGMANLRVVHLAPDLAPVDVVLLDTSGAMPVISRRLIAGLAYSGASTYVSLPAGSYTVALVPAGADLPLLPASGALSLSLDTGTVSTLVAAGCQNPSAGKCASASAALQLVWRQDN